MAKSFKKVIACLLAVLMVLFSVPFTALANSVDNEPNLDIRFGTLAPSYYDYAPDLSSGDWGPKNLHNTGSCGIYGPVLNYTGGVNEETGELEITKLSLDATKTGTAVYLYNEEIADASEFSTVYEGTPQTDYTTGMGFTMTLCLKNMSQIAGVTGYWTYSNNVEPAYIYDSGTTNGNTKAKIGTKAQYDADATKKKALLAGGIIPNQSSDNYFDMTSVESTTIGDGKIALSTTSNTGETIDISKIDTTADDAVVNPTTGELGYDCASDTILVTFGFIITGEISEANPLVIGWDGDKSVARTLQCSPTADDLMPVDRTSYGSYEGSPYNNKMYFMGYNANTKKYLNGSVEPAQHVHTYDEVYTAPTCTTNGYKTLTCNNSDGLGTAGDDVQTVYDDPDTTLDHTPAEAVRENVVDATCTKTGSYDEVVYCSVCKAEISRTAKTIDKIAHTPAADKVGVKAASCTEKGYTGDVVCSVCKEVITAGEEIPMTDHTPAAAVQENVVDATCSKAGSYDEVVYCSVCNAEISRTAKTSAKLPHTPAEAVRENVVDATCTKAGSYDEVVKCSVCGEEISRETKTIDMIAHTPAAAVEENRVEATEDKDGSYDEVVYCSVCNTEISRETKTIPALGHTHSYTSTYTAPTCTSNGFTTYTCVKGDDTYVVYDDPDSTLAHTPAEAVRENVVDATCAKAGSYDEVVYCSVCNAEISRTAKTIDKIAHTPAEAVRENVVEATCTKAGSYDEVVKCSVCGEEISRESKTIDKIAHTPASERTNVKEPTLDAAGYTGDICCTVCGEVLEAGEAIPALEGVNVTITDKYAAFGDVEGLALGTTKVVKGSDVAVTATPAGGCEFVGWQVNNKIVDTNATYKFTAYTDVTVTPVFVDAAAAADTITVVFYDCYMNVTAAYTNVTVADFQAAMAAGIPAGTTYAGKVFNGWSMSDDAIKALDHSATIEANYTDAVNAGYTVTATDGAVFEDGTSEMTGVKYDTEVTVSAEGATAWKINDVIVAYGPTYTFYVGSDVTVTPVKDAVTAKPTVAMVSVDPVEGSHKIAFLATMSAADGYTIIDHGFVYGKAATDDELKIENVGATIAASGTKVKSASLVANSSNQFALNYGIKAKVGTATAVAYITYKDASGKITTDYTKVADGSYTY